MIKEILKGTYLGVMANLLASCTLIFLAVIVVFTLPEGLTREGVLVNLTFAMASLVGALYFFNQSSEGQKHIRTKESRPGAKEFVADLSRHNLGLPVEGDKEYIDLIEVWSRAVGEAAMQEIEKEREEVSAEKEV